MDAKRSNAQVRRLEEGPIRVACLGGGQLGRMMALEAPRLHIEMSILDAGGDSCPAGLVLPGGRVLRGALNDAEKIRKLSENADVVTVEIEHVDVEALAEVERAGTPVRPSSRVIGLIQDKLVQKRHFMRHDLPLGEFREINSRNEIVGAADDFGLPLMLKARKGAYDGRGNSVLKSKDDIEACLIELGCETNEELFIYAEKWVPFECELAVMVVRSCANGNLTKSYPAVNAVQENSICRLVVAPARNVSLETRSIAEKLAERAVSCLGDGAYGVFGVEMFVQKDGSVLLNEVAPRPHNTGHYTQDACATSQFENHLRAITGLPLGDTSLIVECAAMVNVLGAENMIATMKSSNLALEKSKNAIVHWYEKNGCRRGRKMGHINVVGSNVDEHVRELLVLENVSLDLFPTNTNKKKPPLVGVVMGSQSDLPTMNAAIEVLRKFGVPYEVDIVSAHRTPEKLVHYAKTASERGLKVVVAGAGGAAHLPGMLASMTTLPVVGVPVKTSTLSGVDSLYSIVQMPRGVPVATVAIGNSTNAGLLAVRILSTTDQKLAQAMLEYQREMKRVVDESSAALRSLGHEEFLAKLSHKAKEVNV